MPTQRTASPLKPARKKVDGENPVGLVLTHPYFWGKEPVTNEVRNPAIRAKMEGIGNWCS